MQRPRAWAWALAALALAGCGARDDDAVAEVGPRAITGQDLRRFVVTLPPGLRTAKTGPEARADYLQTLVDRELMLLEAGAMGLEDDAALLGGLQRKVEERILALYRQRELQPRVAVTGEAVDAYIADAGLDVERLAEAILVDTEGQAQQLLQDLAAGRDFEALAQERSLDPARGERGGYLGYLNRLSAPRVGIPQAVFDSLEAGAASAPLSWGGKWQVVRFIDERASEDPSLRTGVHSRLAQEQRQEVEDQQVETLAHELGWALADAGLEALRGLAAPGAAPPSPELRRTPLFTYDGGAATVGDYLAALREHRVRTARALTDRDFVAASGDRFLRGRAMLLVAAARLGIPEEPEIAQWQGQIHTELALQALRGRVVADADTMVTPDLVERYYEEHRESFRVPERICFDEILLHTRQEAERVRQEVTDDTQLLALARLRGDHIRRRGADGLLCMTRLGAKVLPEFWAALAEAPPGRVRGPVSLEDQAHVLFKVVRKEPERLQTFDEARRQAHASVRARIERELFDTWMQEVRRRHEREVRIHLDRLEAALPDALLAGATPAGGV